MAPNVIGSHAGSQSGLSWSPSQTGAPVQRGNSAKEKFEGLTDAELRRLRHAFTKYDLNGDGKISKEELVSMLKCLGSDCAEESMEKLVKEIDINSDGFVDFEEFLVLNRCAVQCCTKKKDDLAAAFQLFDLDRDGYISPKDLHTVMGSMGERSNSLADCSAMIRQWDRDGNGKVDLEEFEAMMKEEAAL